MDYKLKNDLIMGGANAINENLAVIGSNELKIIDELACGDISREYVEQVVKDVERSLCR